MLEFEWPYAFLALPLPVLSWLFFKPVSERSTQVLKTPFFEHWFARSGASSVTKEKHFSLFSVLAIAAWFFLVFSLARPVWIGETVELPLSGRDLMLAVDLSGSMERPDFTLNGDQVDRLTVVKDVAGRFIQRRSGDRIGLILFGKRAYVQTPLTFDLTTVTNMLHESVIGLAGKETAIGDAIGLAVKRLRKRPEQSRVLVLLTDGANTAGEVDPVQAAKLAAEAGLKIYTIGVGADRMEIESFFGTRTVDPSADLDEDTLRAIAENTGGQYFRARNTEGLEQVYQQLDALEPMKSDKEIFRPKRQLFYWSLCMAILLYGVIYLIRLNAALRQRNIGRGVAGNV